MRLLAASPPADQVVTGVLGFLVVAGMGLALFFLLRSMNKQLRKVAAGPKWRDGVGTSQAGAAATPDAPGQPGASDQDQSFQQNGTRLP